ncbi:dihydrolipoyl dehydrogenase family protein [Corynebacterium oculi]|uniref:Dihydrolipoyl dehydrogenase n=1 Tax=Corynebacterium oculi TaxID=1544416 RepID=A0A0Q0UEX1_9CORY|nr:FAD-dependent oxidoreductase [Corynebacterium oculi]KQB85233.1 Dihydrolipoyl dehydrogenase [Corynebacterium oculi]
MSTLDLDVVILGFGKAGKTIAMKRGQAGDRVAIVEQSPQMYGGTCINIGCVPTKTLLTDAHRHHRTGDANHATALKEAQRRRDGLTAKLNEANKRLAEGSNVMLIDGRAAFTGERTVEVTGGEERLTITAETVVINTGAVPVRPGILGIDLDRVLDSTQVQRVPEYPRRLAVVGGGPIGLEFATMFAQFGTQVTVLDGASTFLGRYDRDIAQAVRGDLEAQGIEIISGARVEEFRAEGEGVVVRHSGGEVEADYALVAIGRRPATEGLGLDKAGVATTERGAIEVDEHLRTSAPGVYAAGDVTGGPQFTYISYDDHRVILDDRWGDGERTTEGRIFPTTTFVQPPLAQIGMGEDEAREDTQRRGHTLEIKAQDVADMAIVPRPKILEQPQGRAKFLVDKEDDRILGATLYCVDSQELINTVAVAMRHGVAASELGAGIYTHPSSSEVFNALLG